jgi:hypothetical protein
MPVATPVYFSDETPVSTATPLSSFEEALMPGLPL